MLDGRACCHLSGLTPLGITVIRMCVESQCFFSVSVRKRGGCRVCVCVQWVCVQWVCVGVWDADVKRLQLLIHTLSLFDRPHKLQSTNEINILEMKAELMIRNPFINKKCDVTRTRFSFYQSQEIFNVFTCFKVSFTVIWNDGNKANRHIFYFLRR